MNRTLSIMTIALLGLLVLGLLLNINNNNAAAQGRNIGQTNNMALVNHHQETSLSIGPGSTVHTIDLPVQDRPVRIDYSATGLTELGGQPTSPLIGTAVVIQESPPPFIADDRLVRAAARNARKLKVPVKNPLASGGTVSHE